MKSELKVSEHFYSLQGNFVVKPTGCIVSSSNLSSKPQIRINGKLVYISRHILSLKLGRPLQAFACHTCDNPMCVNPDHLFEGTALDNKQDCVSKGRHARGDTNGTSKLTAVKVAMLRKVFDRNKHSLAQFAVKWDVSFETVRAALCGVTWNWLPGAHNDLGMRKGGLNHKAKLNADKVREIRRLRNDSKITLEKLARKYGVTIAAVHNVVIRRTWRHV